MAHLKESLTHLCKVLAPNCKACPRAGKSNIGASITQTCHFLGGSEAGICAAPLGSYPGSLPAARGSGVKRQDGPRESAGPGPEGTVQGRAQAQLATILFTFSRSYLQSRRCRPRYSAHTVLTRPRPGLWFRTRYFCPRSSTGGSSSAARTPTRHNGPIVQRSPPGPKPRRRNQPPPSSEWC